VGLKSLKEVKPFRAGGWEIKQNSTKKGGAKRALARFLKGGGRDKI